VELVPDLLRKINFKDVKEMQSWTYPKS
jgi:hypothetical protein